MPGLHILCVYNDKAFGAKSIPKLSDAGYQITEADCALEAERDFTKENYQAVVIGPGLVRFAKEELAIKAWESGCAVVVVCSDKSDYTIQADSHLALEKAEDKLAPEVLKVLTAKLCAVAG
ncbi:MAG TPA: hypothetical protein VN577_03285 [Terriglobales bacterium]|nr:hypothetical protein [Terriglobales bacterium]